MAADTNDNDRITVAHLAQSALTSEFTWSDAVLLSPAEDPRHQETQRQAQPGEQHGIAVRADDQHQSLHSAFDLQATSPFHRYGTIAHNQIDAGPSGSTTGRRLDGHSSPPVPSSSPLYDPLSYDSFLELRFPESNPFESEPTTLSIPVAQHPARALGATTTITTREAIESLRSLADLEAPYSSPTPTAPQQHGSAAPDSHSCRGPSTSRQHCFAPSLWEWTDMDSSSSAMENRQPFEGDADEECISPASQHQPLNLDMALSSSPPKSQTYAASAETSAVPQSSAQATARTNRCIPSMVALAPRVYTGVSQNLQRPVTMNQASTSLERSSSGSSSSLSGQQTQAQSSWNLSAMPPPRMYASSEAVQPKDGYAAWHMGQARLAAGVSAASPTVESAQGSPDSASLSSTAQRGSGGGSAVPETKVSPSGLVASAAITPSSTIPLNEGTRPWNPSATTLGRMMPSSSSSSSLLALTPFEVMGSQLRDLDEEFSQSDAAATATATAMAGGGEKPYMPPSPTHIGAGATLPGGEEGMTPSDEQIRYMAAVGTGREEQSTGEAVGKMLRKSSMVDEARSSAQHKSSKGMLSKVDLTKGSANHHPRAKASTNRPESMYESAQAALEDMVGYHQPKVKPTQPYPNLIRLTLLTSATGKLCLSELYEAMADNFPWFKTQGMGWKNSIRHNLSINSSFLRIDRSGKDDKSKGSLWFVDTQVEPASVRPSKTTPSGRGGIRAPRSKLVSAAEAELKRENEDDDEDHSELDQDAEGETDSEQGGAGEPTGGHRITDAGQDDSQMAETATDVADKVAVKHEDPEAGNLASFSSQQAGPSSIRMQDTGSTGARRTSYSLMATHQKKTPTRGQLGMSTAAATDPKPRTRSGAQKRCREDSSQGSSQGRGHGHEHARPPIPPSPHFIVVPHTIATGPATAPVMDSRSSTRGHQVEMHSPFMPMQMDSSPAPSGSSLPRLIPFGMMGAPVTAPIAMGVASESSYLFGSTSPLPFMTGPFTTTATLPRFWEASRCPACGRWRAECICHMSAFQQGALMGQQQQQQPQQQELPSPAFCSYPMPLQHSQSVPRGMATAFPATPARRHHPYTHPGAGFGTSANGSASTSSGNSGPLQYSSSSSSSASPYGNLAEGSARSVPLSIGQPYRTAESQMPPPPPLPSPERGAVRDGNLSLSSSVAAGSSQSGTGYPGSSLTSLWYPSSSPWATTPQDGAGQIPAGGVPESPSENAKRSKMARQSASSSSSSSSSLPPLSIGALVDTVSAEDTAARDLLALRTGSGGADPMSAGSVGVADDDAAPGTGTAVGEDEQAEMSS
ncbi:unnamed protein product [Tilletia laevis]|uniref:Fork-head domain-containing protein n=2 Tax=Tilletia TaxID=13289 RepID=A0A177U8Q4_9BASI|nr:hypothetical protein CF336_g5068 [Tilletia laevis]KAE8256973.1 hypothetical protein A4X03_0g4871 [Tilletia caries]KAE8196653.1 hypothetical protein CF335_g4805 [Tilletia laevis]CAD6884589.1 unnamed protein product [Tilletia caries]CAD6904802.1 unnamed protein product [Tilletia laevis]